MEKDKISASAYSAIHHWLKYHYGVADRCENKKCIGKSKNYQWAKKREKEYDWKRSNFIRLCSSCHAKYDFTEETREKNKLANVQKNKTHCHKGHAFTEANTFMRYGKYRVCRACRSEYKRIARAKRSANRPPLTKERRIEIAKNAVAAREAKRLIARNLSQ